jgi:UDP-N-acetylglucosamine 2-epimerase (non-hydrolysing)
MIIFGTRPEAIKMAPVVKEFLKYPKRFKTIVCVTSQHREMLDQVLKLFNIRPDVDLNLMQENQTLDSLTSNALRELTKTLEKVKPDLILVQGDTTTAMVGALAAFYKRIPIGHVEAGLRTKDRYNPFPEEINRRIISVLATHHFAPTNSSFKELIKEGIPKDNIFLTGNTVVDALKLIAKRKFKSAFNLCIPVKSRLILVTAHRRENFGLPLENICLAIKSIVQNNPDIEVVYPVHLNPNVKGVVYRLLSGIKRIHLIRPIDYQTLVFLLKQSYLVLTDSGGIQEEAPTFGKPVLVMRAETERPEGVKAGVAKLVGVDKANIIKQVQLLISDIREYNKMSKSISPYGDGKAAKRIVSVILKEFKKD